MATYTYSKQVTRQLKEATKAARSALESASTITAVVDKKLAALLGDGGPQVDWDAFQKTAGLLLDASSESLRQVDEEHAQLEVNGQFLRQLRDEAADQLRVELRRARFLLDETLSKEDAKTLFPQRRNLSTIDPANLVRLGRHISALLRGDVAKVRTRTEGGELLNAEALAQAIDTATAGLAQVFDDLEPKQRQEALSFAKRLLERKEVLRTYRSTKQMLSGLYRLAGYDYLAEQLRDRRRRPGTEEEGEASSETMTVMSEPTPEATEGTAA